MKPLPLAGQAVAIRAQSLASNRACINPLPKRLKKDDGIPVRTRGKKAGVGWSGRGRGRLKLDAAWSLVYGMKALVMLVTLPI